MIKQCTIRILSVDDHLLFREGIAAVINNQPDMLFSDSPEVMPAALTWDIVTAWVSVRSVRGWSGCVHSAEVYLQSAAPPIAVARFSARPTRGWALPNAFQMTVSIPLNRPYTGL